MSNSSFDKYEVNTADFDSGDFSTGRVAIGGGWFANYKKVGKLYFGFYFDNLPSNVNGLIGESNPFGGNPPAAEAAVVAAALGITLSTYFFGQHYGQGFIQWTGVAWNYNAPGNQYNTFLTGILAT